MINLIDSVVSALSLHITNPDDIVKYEEAYDKIRQSILYKKKENIQEFEPMRQNRYLLLFPENLNIRPWQIKRVSLPSLKRDFWGRKKWGNMSIELFSVIGLTSTYDLIRHKKFDAVFQTLDPTGVICQELIIKIDLIHKMDITDFHYESDELAGLYIQFKIKDVIVNY